MTKSGRCNHVRILTKDSVLADVISTVGPLRDYYRERTDFETVCRIIVGQQLSYRAASTIWLCVQRACKPFTPSKVSKERLETLRQCGLSKAKATYLKDVADRVSAGEFNFDEVRRCADEEASSRLRTIRGFGPWSVEMFLIFGMGRPDVFSETDAGLRRAVCRLYGVTKTQYEASIRAISDQWRPYRSYACRYLWAWLDGK
jgi:DNA-3-methyladenine glycosylase II